MMKRSFHVPKLPFAKRRFVFGRLIAGVLFIIAVFIGQATYALQGQFGIHDPSTIIKRNGVYHVWGTGDQIYHLTSTDLIRWTVAPTVFPGGTWPSWINNYVPGFSGFFWAPECVYMNGRYYMYYSCSMGNRECAIGVATSTDLTNWTDQGMVIYSTQSSNYGSIDAAVFQDANNRWWMTFGSHLAGIWITEINPSTGKRLNNSLTNIAGGGSWVEHEAPYIIRNGGYYYLFYNRGVCCNGTNSTYYVQMGRSTSPTGPYVDRNGVNLLNGGGTTVLSGSGNYRGPGHIGLYSENGFNFVTYHYYNSNANGAPTLAVGNMGWASGWPFITQDWIAAGRYKITNRHSGLVWDAWGCTGVANQGIAQGTSIAGLACQHWDFTTLGNGVYRITCALGGLSADVVNCGSGNGAQLQLYSWLNNNCQKFRLERAADGSLVITPLNSSRVVEVPNASSSAGVRLALFDYNGHNCQKWTVTTASSSSRLSVAEESVSDLDEHSSIVSVTPNPANSGAGFNVQLSDMMNNEVVQIKMINTAGRVFEDVKVKNKSSVTVGQGAKPGFYVIQIRGNHRVINKKVVVN